MLHNSTNSLLFFYELFMLFVVIVHSKLWHKFCFKELSRNVKEKSVDSDHFDPSKMHTKNIISKEENILKWCINSCVRLFFLFFFSRFPFVPNIFVLSMSEYLTIHFFHSLCSFFSEWKEKKKKKQYVAGLCRAAIHFISVQDEKETTKK